MIEREQYPYRQGVIAFILNVNGELLLVQHAKYKDNEWRQPGGGIEIGESEMEAAFREVDEELGIKNTDLELLGVSKEVNQYDFPQNILEENVAKGRNFRGQEQRQVLFRLAGEPVIKTDEHEIKRYTFVAISELDQYLVFPNQYDKTMLAINDFRQKGWIA